MTEIKIYESPQETIDGLAGLISQISKQAILKDGKFTIALSGGNTPKKLYRLLAGKEYQQKINWQKSWITWSDERYVAPTDPESNVGMAMDALINQISIPVNQVLKPDTSLKPEVAAKQYEKILVDSLGADPMFDLILLGLGEDGHTASLFPGTDILHEKTAMIKEVFVPQKKSFRISFTSKLINQAKNVAFLVIGKEKAGIINQLLNHCEPPYPARLIHPNQGDLYWFLDTGAASIHNHKG